MGQRDALPPGFWITNKCPSGKRCYFTKTDAKRAARVTRRSASNVSARRPRAYHCRDCDHWHAGHLAEAVIEGTLDRSDMRHGGPPAP